MRKPNTFIVGAPKCGTTALSRFLREHPQVFFSTPKELNYFNRDAPSEYRRRALDGRVIDTDEQYLELFRGAGQQHRVIAEGSVWYLASPVALAAIAGFNPEVRIIVMLRNPVEMAPSLHAEELASFHEDVRDFAAAWGLQEERRRGRCLPPHCLAPSHLQYRWACSLGTQLERALAMFDRARCLPILLDDLASDAASVWRLVQEFLGLDQDGRREFPRINERRRHRVPLLSRVLLARPPYWALAAAKAIKRTTGLRSLGIRPLTIALAVAKSPPQALAPPVRAMLVAAFEAEITTLESLLGRDLSHWRRVDGV